jgi:hypothetical protein
LVSIGQFSKTSSREDLKENYRSYRSAAKSLIYIA